MTFELGTTLRLTAHLWKREKGRYGDILVSKCGAVVTTANGVDPYMDGDKRCRKCFPNGADPRIVHAQDSSHG